MGKKIEPAKPAKVSWSIPVVKGVQKRREVLLGFVSFRTLKQMFDLVSVEKGKACATEDAIEMANYGQRNIDPKRVIAIRDYISKNQDNYILPPVTISVDNWELNSKGEVVINYDAKLHIIDGQHRIAACSLVGQAFNMSGKLNMQEECIGVYLVRQTERHIDRQSFADINSTAKVVPASKNILFNGRDERAVWIQKLEQSDAFAAMVDWKAVSPKKGKLISASGLYSIAKEFTKEDSFLSFLGPVLKIAEQQESDSVFGSLVVLCALARYYDWKHYKDKAEWLADLRELFDALKWERSEWEGVCVFNNALSKSAKLVNDTYLEIRKRYENSRMDQNRNENEQRVPA